MSLAPTTLLEEQILSGGAVTVAGVDEVGRGALAGPVTVGVCVIDRGKLVEPFPAELRDSKLISRQIRERLVEPLQEWAVDYAVGHASPAEIDEIGITAALRLAWTRALADLRTPPSAVILDGKHNWLTPPSGHLFDDGHEVALPVTMKIKADVHCASVAAASVLAKVARDHVMREAHERFPEFGFASNVGYGSSGHMTAMRRFGITEIHRKSWNLPTRDKA